MKKQGILNSEIARVLAGMGHTDRICIADCGLPIPEGVQRIDLTVRLGSPLFIEVLSEVLKDMKVEEAVLASEIKTDSQGMYQEVEHTLARFETGFKTTLVPHEEFKGMLKQCKAIIRTGEITPYANVILQSGCIF